MLNFPVSLRKPLLNSEFESILNEEENLVVCSINAIDLDDSPLIDSPIAVSYTHLTLPTTPYV